MKYNYVGFAEYVQYYIYFFCSIECHSQVIIETVSKPTSPKKNSIIAANGEDDAPDITAVKAQVLRKLIPI